MSEVWTWTYHDTDGRAMSGERLATTAFPTQSDAENWLGETWRELAEDGVDSVTLHHGDDVVYGPMSLRPAE